MKNILVFYGGKSTEHDISIITALQAVKNINKSIYNVIPIYCYFGEFLTSKAACDIKSYIDFDYKKWNNVYFSNGYMFEKKLRTVSVKIDCALLCNHGGGGENGCLQGYLETVNIPYTSANTLASSICMDKVASKEFFKAIGMDIVDYVEICKDDYLTNKKSLIYYIESMLSFPIIVKPADLGSSIGIKTAKDIESLKDAVKTAFGFSDRIICEKALTDFTEFNCAGINSNLGLFISDIEKPVGWQEFLSFDDKYLNNGKMSNQKSEFPANIDEELAKKIQSCTEKLIKNLKIDGVVRCDYLYSNQTEKLYINEINTIPGSLAYYLFKNQFGFQELLNILIEDAIFRFDKRSHNSFSYKTDVLLNYKKGCNKLAVK